jgi:cell division initiation protein
MDLSPDLRIEDVTFREVRRGYDPDEVDDFLERVAQAVARLQSQLVDAVERARSLEDRLESQPSADPATAPGADEIQRTLLLAQRTADAAISEANEEAARRTSEAERDAARIVGDAEAHAAQHREEARRRLLEEITGLEAGRDELRNQVTILERHVDEQRGQLRSSIHELQRLLDDPDGLRIEAPPVPAPLPAETAPIALHGGGAPDPDATVVVEVPSDPDMTVVAEMPPPPVERSSPPAEDSDPSEGDAEDDEPAGVRADEPDVAAGAGGTGGGEDAFLAELRQAMADDGDPRPGGDDEDGHVAPSGRPRFGRRR